MSSLNVKPFCLARSRSRCTMANVAGFRPSRMDSISRLSGKCSLPCRVDSISKISVASCSESLALAQAGLGLPVQCEICSHRHLGGSVDSMGVSTEAVQ